ncbi:MAG: hypothetical protein AAGG99_09545, partial [Pseudomonadota bacterium]
FLVEALTGFVVHEIEPAGAVTSDNVAWLISAIAPSGRLTSHRLRECVVSVLNRISPTPIALRAFLISCLRADVGNGCGVPNSLVARNAAALDSCILEVAGSVFATLRPCGLRLTRPELDDIRAIDGLDAVSESGVWQRFVSAMSAVSLLDSAEYAVPDSSDVLAYIRGERASSWQACQFARLTREQLTVRTLERQRAAIFVGPPPRLATSTDFAAAWGGIAGYDQACQELTAAGYDIRIAAVRRPVNAA